MHKYSGFHKKSTFSAVVFETIFYIFFHHFTDDDKGSKTEIGTEVLNSAAQ
jgi:hypothetical protein